MGCFDDATSVLDREAFDVIREIVPAALTIAVSRIEGSAHECYNTRCSRLALRCPGRLSRDHIGKGSYCDVFDVVYKGSQHARLKTNATYALKRLRLQLRSDVDKFTLGAEDRRPSWPASTTATSSSCTAAPRAPSRTRSPHAAATSSSWQG